MYNFKNMLKQCLNRNKCVHNDAQEMSQGYLQFKSSSRLHFLFYCAVFSVVSLRQETKGAKPQVHQLLTKHLSFYKYFPL